MNEFDQLAAQNLQLIQRLDNLWTALVVLIFVMIAFMGLMVGLAAWSVYTVNKSAGERIVAVTLRQSSIEDSWKQVLQLLLRNIRNLPTTHAK